MADTEELGKLSDQIELLNLNLEKLCLLLEEGEVVEALKKIAKQPQISPS